MKRTTVAGIALMLAFIAGGCTSGPVLIAPQPPVQYDVLGPAAGTAVGGLYVDGTIWNFVPILLNSRVDRAYRDAVASVPGATGLINVTLQESWYWIVIGTLRVSKIRGDAIKEL